MSTFQSQVELFSAILAQTLREEAVRTAMYYDTMMMLQQQAEMDSQYMQQCVANPVLTPMILPPQPMSPLTLPPMATPTPQTTKKNKGKKTKSPPMVTPVPQKVEEVKHTNPLKSPPSREFWGQRA